MAQPPVIIQRVPIASSVFPDTTGSGIPNSMMSTSNCLYSKYPDGRLYSTQRFAVNISDYPGADSTGTGANTAGSKGRGIYFWNFSVSGVTEEHTYIINDNKIYVDNYSTAVQTITTGKDPCYFFEIGNYLFITDPQNTKAWYATKAAYSTFTEMTTAVDADWPFVSNVKMTGGGAVLNGILYLMDTDGKIWNSAADTPTSWTGTDFITAARSTDSGVYLTSHHDNIVAISSKSLEFFYDAGNPNGSPLQRREDIFYNTGCLDRKRAFNSGDLIFFVGADKVGTAGVFVLDNFSLSKVSDDAIDRYLAITLSGANFDIFTTGGTVAEHRLFFLTVTSSDSATTFTPTCTLVYDLATQTWSEYTSSILNNTSYTAFSVIGNSERGIGSRDAKFIFSSGEVGAWDFTGNMSDSKGAGGAYMASGYIVNQDDYIQPAVYSSTAAIDFIIFTGEVDFGTMTNKFLHRLSLAGTTSKAAVDATPITISWSDDRYKTILGTRYLDTADHRSLTRLGKFKRRAFKIAYAGSDRLLIEGLELDIRLSNYA